MSKATITIFTKRLPVFVYDEILRDINESIMIKSYVSKDKANIKSDLFSISIVKVEGNGLPMQYRGIRESLILLDGIEPTKKEILEFLDPSTNGSVKGCYFKYDDFMRISDITKYTNMAQYAFGVLHREYKKDIEDKIRERELEELTRKLQVFNEAKNVDDSKLVTKEQLKAIRNKHGKTVNPVNIFVLDVARCGQGNRTGMLIGNVSDNGIEVHDLFVFKQNMKFYEQAKVIYNLYVDYKPEYILLGEQGLSAGLVDVLIDDFGFGVLNKNDDRNDDKRVLYVMKDYTENSNYITSFLSILDKDKISLQKEVIPNVISNCTDLLCEELDNLNVFALTNGKLGLKKIQKDNDCGLAVCLLKLCWFANNYKSLIENEKHNNRIVQWNPSHIELSTGNKNVTLHRDSIKLVTYEDGVEFHRLVEKRYIVQVATDDARYDVEYLSHSEMINEYNRIKEFLGVK